MWTSLVGYNLVYNTLDNNRRPTSGLFAELRQDFAGVGGDVSFLRTTTDWRFYYEVYADVVAMVRLQGGHIVGIGNQEGVAPDGTIVQLPGLRMLDHFFMGPNLVRGFATAGIGPRDLTLGTNLDALGGSMYWGTTFELQMPIWGLPKDVGVRWAVFADAGSLWNYQGPNQQQLRQIFSGLTITPSDNAMKRARFGRRRPVVGFAVRTAASRLRPRAAQGGLRYRRGGVTAFVAGGPVATRSRPSSSAAERSSDDGRKPAIAQTG